MIIIAVTDGDYIGEGCFLEDSNGQYRSETTTTAMVDTDLCYLLKSDLADVKEEFPEVETSIHTAMNEKSMADGPRRMFGEASGGDGELNAAEVRKLLTTQCHFSEGPALEQLMTDLDLNGNGVVDEFAFAAWHRARHAEEQAQYRQALDGKTLGQLTQWCTLTHLEDGQIEKCLDSPKPQAALVDKILSTPRLLRLLHEDENLEREYYMRFLGAALKAETGYLSSRLAENGLWRKRNATLNPEMLRDTAHISAGAGGGAAATTNSRSMYALVVAGTSGGAEKGMVMPVAWKDRLVIGSKFTLHPPVACFCGSSLTGCVYNRSALPAVAAG